MAGLFITFDGLDGCGKSTQARLLADWLRLHDRTVTECRDPGGTEMGDRLRSMLLDKSCNLTLPAETFLFMASRSELVHHVIRPALSAGHAVVCDRFLLATVVYQGHAGGLDIDAIWRMGEVATGKTFPDLTLVVDLPVEAAIVRRNRAADRMESRGLDYHQLVRAGFLAEASKCANCRVIDGSADIASVHNEICRHVEPLLRRSN